MKSSNNSIVVIGAGPAGMLAALEAARSGHEVILLEKNARCGRKLSVTGGGRGNLTNLNVKPQQYTSHNLDLVRQVLQKTSPQELIDYLATLGILTYHTDDGWVYPVSNSAASVTALLEARVMESGVKLVHDFAVSGIRCITDGFQIQRTGGDGLLCRKVIIATGGKAYPELGSTGEFYKILEKLGHTIWPVQPALAPIVADMRAIQKLQGIRLDARVSLWRSNERVAETLGNIIFTNWGVNGPGVMDISHHVNFFPHEQLYLQIDFLGSYGEHFLNLLDANRQSRISLAALLGAVIPPKLVSFILEKVDIPAASLLFECDESTIQRMLVMIRQFRIAVTGLKGFDQCQVSTGGISLAEVDAETLQSKIIPGVYFAGEILDVSGPCGGYNLQWAFASGITAGKGCSKQI